MSLFTTIAAFALKTLSALNARCSPRSPCLSFSRLLPVLVHQHAYYNCIDPVAELSTYPGIWFFPVEFIPYLVWEAGKAGRIGYRVFITVCSTMSARDLKVVAQPHKSKAD